MLQRDSEYEVAQIEPAHRKGQPAHESVAEWLEGLRERPARVHGAWAAQQGLPLPRVKAEVATLLHLRRCA